MANWSTVDSVTSERYRYIASPKAMQKIMAGKISAMLTLLTFGLALASCTSMPMRQNTQSYTPSHTLYTSPWYQTEPLWGSPYISPYYYPWGSPFYSMGIYPNNCPYWCSPPVIVLQNPPPAVQPAQPVNPPTAPSPSRPRIYRPPPGEPFIPRDHRLHPHQSGNQGYMEHLDRQRKHVQIGGQPPH